MKSRTLASSRGGVLERAFATGESFFYGTSTGSIARSCAARRRVASHGGVFDLLRIRPALLALRRRAGRASWIVIGLGVGLGSRCLAGLARRAEMAGADNG